MGGTRSVEEPELVARAREGDAVAFDRLTAPYRPELLAHCYRMLGSPDDADDALQEALLGAWRGLAGYAARSSVRTWLYLIATNACLRLLRNRPRRLLTPDYGPPRAAADDLGEPVTGPVWLEPLPDELVARDPGPAERYLSRESVELAFVAALQHLPGTQRAVLVLREVLQYPAEEVAEMLDTTVAAVNSALQRARATVRDRVPPVSQQAELASIGAAGQRRLVESIVAAWHAADVAGLVALLTDDVRFTMPPLPAWFDGRDAVAQFLASRVFATPWRLVPIRANAQPGFACYQQMEPGAPFRLGAINVLRLRAGRIAEISGFVDPHLHRVFALPPELPRGN